MAAIKSLFSGPPKASAYIPAPTGTDPTVVAAQQQEQNALAAASGQGSTVFTSGQGDTSPAQLAKQTLLGVG